jgi:hypothetical protein
LFSKLAQPVSALVVSTRSHTLNRSQVGEE